MKTVKDVNDTKLQLLPTRLLELPRHGVFNTRWTVTFKELRRVIRDKKSLIRIGARLSDNPHRTHYDELPVGFSLEHPRIGCRFFDPKTICQNIEGCGC